MDDPSTSPDRPGPAARGEPLTAKLMRLRTCWMEAKILMTGVELGLYDRLARGPADAEGLARDLGLTGRGVEILADALVATGYLTREQGRYANSPEVDRLLVRGRRGGMAHALGHGNHMFNAFARLEEVIRHGLSTPEKDKALLTDPAANRNFILAMAEGSRGRVGPVLDLLPLAGARRFCDLGGGPGQFACEAARRHPELEVVLVDLPLTVEVAREQIAAGGLQDRVTTRAWDFFEEPELDLGGPVDVVLISQVLHAEGPDENRALLRKLSPHVTAGGVVAVAENVVDETRTAPLPGAMFAVNMLANTQRGRTYTAAEIASWLAEAGFEPEPPVEAAERAWVIQGRKPR